MTVLIFKKKKTINKYFYFFDLNISNTLDLIHNINREKPIIFINFEITFLFFKQ